MYRIWVLCLAACLCCASCAPDSSKPGAYRIRLTIDSDRVFGNGHEDFPVLVETSAPNLRLTSNGGHVSSENGSDITFTADDGTTVLPYYIALYDPKTGRIRAWVKVPFLAGGTDTILYLYYGGPAESGADTIRDEKLLGVVHSNGVTSLSGPIDAAPFPKELNCLTVEAWVSTTAYRPEAMQPVVAKWALSETFDEFDAYDAGETDGLRTIGYFGAVFDGRYVYFSPQRYGHELDSTHGHVLRYDTHGNFRDAASWSAYDAGGTDGLNCRGHYGAVFDGRYVYFVPRGKNYGGQTGTFNEFQSNLLRYDTRGGFKDSSSWQAYDMGVNISKQSAAFDGRYIYFCPGYEPDGPGGITDSSRIIRYDTGRPFKSPESYRILNISRLLKAETGNYDGAAFDGRYIYFVPLVSSVVLRYDTTGDFGDAGNWQTYDAKPHGMGMNVGAIFDGRWLYFAAYGSGLICRYDTSADFTAPESWSAYDGSETDRLDTGGFDGGFFDGRYVYFAPFVSRRADGSGYNFHTNWLRYDTAAPFDAPGSWSAHDAHEVDGLATIGYNAGAFDGRFIYLAPWQDRTDGKFGIHGNVLRYDTTGNGASFALKYGDYGHNGGLNAAIMGPSFTINTTHGPVNASSHKPLLPGAHHLAGVYDGSTITLYVDGVPVVRRAALGTVQNNDTPVTAGSFANGTATFDGTIEDIRISRTAHTADWIRTVYENHAAPGEFVRAGVEEAR